MAIFEVTATEVVQRCAKCDTERRIPMASLQVGITVPGPASGPPSGPPASGPQGQPGAFPAPAQGATSIDGQLVPLPICPNCNSIEYLVRSAADEPEYPAPGSFGHLHRLLVDHLHSELVKANKVAPQLKDRTGRADGLGKPIKQGDRDKFFKDALKIDPTKFGLGAKAAKESKDTKDGKDAKDTKDTKDAKDAKDTKDTKDAKDAKDGKDTKDTKDAKDAKDTKDTKDAKDVKDTKDGKDTKDTKDVKDTKDTKDGKDTKDVKDTKDAKDGKDTKDTKDTKERKDTKEKELKEAAFKEKDLDRTFIQDQPVDMAEFLFGTDAPVSDSAPSGRAFIRAEERPPVGEQVIRESGKPPES